MTQLYTLIKKTLSSVKSEVNENLEGLNKWFKLNKLSLNVKKTKLQNLP